MLGAQGLVHRAGHLDIALRTVCLRVFKPAPDQSFADEDEPTIEVHVAPLQPVDLPGAHAGEEPDRVVVPKVRSDGV